MRTLLLIILTAGILSGCKPEAPILRIGVEPSARELALRIAAAYQEAYPGHVIRLIPGVTELTSDSIDFVIQAESDPGNSRVMAWSAVLTVFSSDHPAIQQVARYGASPAQLRALFQGRYTSWRDLRPEYPDHPIQCAGLHPDHPIAKRYYAFLGKNPDSSVHLVGSPEALALILSNNPLGIGFLASDLAYDGRTGFRRSGLYIMPLDQDSSGTISDSEYIFDNVDMLGKAISSGAYPAELSIAYYLSAGPGENPLRDQFIHWYYESGKDACQKAGFLFPQSR